MSTKPDSLPSPSRVFGTMDEAAAFAEGLRRSGRRVVFANGVFDLIHPGHLRYLQAARREGDALIVGVHSDRSVRASKGPDRPIIPESERAELIAALACVDGVLVCDEETRASVVRAIKPDVLVSRGEWARDDIDVVVTGGGRVAGAPSESDYSTTEIIRRVKALPRRRQ